MKAAMQDTRLIVAAAGGVIALAAGAVGVATESAVFAVVAGAAGVIAGVAGVALGARARQSEILRWPHDQPLAGQFCRAMG